jgi:hypothetical protein
VKQTRWLLAVVLLSLSLGACGEDKKSCDLTGNDRAFGACCTAGSQCTSGVCHEFGDGTQECTLACTVDADCPEGSQGKKCNNQQVCRT